MIRTPPALLLHDIYMYYPSSFNLIYVCTVGIDDRYSSWLLPSSEKKNETETALSEAPSQIFFGPTYT
jgi:hypothetical protein